ncbi:MAG: glycosyltransferase family 4 protein, partial [bacterium]
MKILVLTPTFLPVVGGAELVLFEVYRRLARRHDVLLVTPILSPDLLRDQALEEYAHLIPFRVERYHDRVSFMRIRGHRWTAGAIPPFSLSAAAAVREAARRFNPDVLNVHYLMPTGFAGVMAERWLGVPTVLTLNGRDVPGPGVPILWRWWQRALVKLVTDVTYVSQYCRTALYRSNQARGQVIYNGVEIPPPAGEGVSVRTTLEIPVGEPLIFSL